MVLIRVLFVTTQFGVSLTHKLTHSHTHLHTCTLEFSINSISMKLWVEWYCWFWIDIYLYFFSLTEDLIFYFMLVFYDSFLFLFLTLDVWTSGLICNHCHMICGEYSSYVACNWKFMQFFHIKKRFQSIFTKSTSYSW